MLTYTPDEIHTHIARILGSDDFILRAIGNHDLGRHLVYQVTPAGAAPVVLKIYCKKNRRSREIASLNLLVNTGVKCAVIADAGSLPDGTEWLLYTFFPGKILDRVWDQMSPLEEQRMFEALGNELGKIHCAATFPFFGQWDERGESLYDFKYYFTEFVRSSEYVIRHLKCKKLPDQVLLNRAVSIIRKNYSLIESIRVSRLTHHDYDGRNILVDHESGHWKIQGIIDFEQSYPGNCEIDLAGIYARYLMGDAQREESFFKGYHKHLAVEDSFYQRLPYYLLCKGIVICSWTYGKAPAYYEEGIRLIERFHTLV